MSQGVRMSDFTDPMDAAVIQSSENVRFEPEIYPDEALRLLTLGLGILRAAALLFIVIFGGRYAMSVMKVSRGGRSPMKPKSRSSKPRSSKTRSTPAADGWNSTRRAVEASSSSGECSSGECTSDAPPRSPAAAPTAVAASTAPAPLISGAAHFWRALLLQVYDITTHQVKNKELYDRKATAEQRWYALP